MDLLQTLALAVAAFFLIGLISAGRRRHRLPPGPTPLPIIGNILQLGDQPQRALARLATIHGPLFSLHLGAVTTVVASTPEAARDVLLKHDAAFSGRYVPDVASTHAPISVVWAPPGPLWRMLRKICTTQLFAPKRLDAHRSLRRRKVDEMIAFVEKLSEKKETVEIDRVAFTTSLNVVSNTIFSTDVADLESSSSREFMDIITKLFDAAGQPNVSDFFPVLAGADLQGVRRRVQELLGRLYAVFDELIERRLEARAAGQPAAGDVLDVLLDLSEKELDDGVVVDRATMRGFFVDLFAGGTETSTSTLEWAMTELLRHPQAMARAQKELAEVVGHGREMDESDIAGLPYLRAVVKETFRLHPPGPFLSHGTLQAADVGEYSIPEGTRILINVWAIGRSEAVWKDAEQFTPERFLDSSVDFRGHDFELLPFGAGRRVCPGIPLADRMLHLMLGSLLQRFRWSVAGEPAEGGGVDCREKFGLALRKAVPLRALAMSAL